MTLEVLTLTIGSGVLAVSAVFAAGAWGRTRFLSRRVKALAKKVDDQQVLIHRLEEVLASQVMEEESIDGVAQVIRIERTMRDFKALKKEGILPSSALEAAQSMWGTTRWDPKK